MTLPTGTKLGSYEILSPLGAGGMGEVYRARNTCFQELPEEGWASALKTDFTGRKSI